VQRAVAVLVAVRLSAPLCDEAARPRVIRSRIRATRAPVQTISTLPLHAETGELKSSRAAAHLVSRALERIQGPNFRPINLGANKDASQV